ncbi:hypothetical protein BATDEDRAFT_35836 [Batrachochytrium dendrobatidis JAM81]|uniref:Splicing factor 3A subunit 1 n=2 Tax=Batrachochytrium dendrobatidis TaxID=109871 RepID=F4P9S4_BATDJ|nr:uncharacterized protein BATDEDRAFT_35836 [Batrachochytrium dendrobatidis JAM81]EGF77967.1 hypothetical protein BATDEDRAFT_35836 [Batrachochytrium dendrobatidis JAM81]OAJ43952.1 hypothetical protein BDEG_27263 [Batrachochytrium dendrobatidis JEL423]|eukprot:XP_006681450.1 hypothetical protein BATDEDRAFT_35836 [Batrachochytrium dendrobatidis JAM81]
MPTAMTVDGVIAMETDQQQTIATVPGLIYPPPEIRNIVDKTADFVARNGPQFEERIQAKEQSNPKFSFMTVSDPYHAYYQHRINEARQGRTAAALSAEKAKVDELPEMPKVVKYIPKEPPAYLFSATLPAISRQDLDIIKLTAQFSARNGRTFQTSLLQRESKNFQFDFMRPSHSLYGYYNRLVEQYAKVISPSESLIETLRTQVRHKLQILDRVSMRVEHQAYLAEESRKAQQEADEEQIAFATIDWHDFVVVDTIEFVEVDERSYLPPPMSVVELESMTLEQRRTLLSFEKPPEPEIFETVVETAEEQMEDDDIDMDMEDDDENDSALMAPAAQQVTKIQDTTQPTNIRTDYIPKVGRATQAAEPIELCPVCGASVKASEMAEHVRIELLDPRWKDQRNTYQSKQRDSNLVPLDPNILSKISDYRPDIFGGGDNLDVNRKLAEDTEKARDAEKKKVIWDGHSNSIASASQKMQQSSVENQVIVIQQQMEQNAALNAIGPKLPGSAPMPFTPGMPFPGMPFGAVSYPGMPFPMPGMPPPGMPPVMPAMPPPPFGVAPGAFPPPPGMPPLGFGIPPSPFPFPGAMPVGVAPPLPPGVVPLPLAVPESATSAKHAIPTDEMDHALKKAKTEIDLQKLITLSITMPTGESLQADPADMRMTVAAFKEHIAGLVGTPASKQKLVMEDNTVLKNALTLESYALVNGSVLELSTRGRGGGTTKKT